MRLIILSDLSGEARCGHRPESGGRRLHRQTLFVARSRCPDLRGAAHARPRREITPALSCDDLMLDAATNRVTARGKPLQLARRGISAAGIFDVAPRPHIQPNATAQVRFGAATRKSTSARSMSTCSGCAKSRANEATRLISKPYGDLAIGLRRRLTRNEHLITLLLVPRDVPRLSSSFVSKSSSPSHRIRNSKSRSWRYRGHLRTRSCWTGTPTRRCDCARSSSRISIWVSKAAAPNCCSISCIIVEMDTLFLVGDIIDVWSMQRSMFWPQSHNNVLRTILGKAKRGTKVIFVPWQSRRGVPRIRRRGVRQSRNSSRVRPSRAPTAGACWCCMAMNSTVS